MFCVLRKQDMFAEMVCAKRIKYNSWMKRMEHYCFHVVDGITEACDRCIADVKMNYGIGDMREPILTIVKEWRREWTWQRRNTGKLAELETNVTRQIQGIFTIMTLPSRAMCFSCRKCSQETGMYQICMRR